MIKTYWKRFEGSVTDWSNKYRLDLFFRTEANVIALQTAFALLILGIIFVSFLRMHDLVSQTIAQWEKLGVPFHSPNDLGSTIMSETQRIGMINLVVVAAIIILATILFNYVITRIALTPMRNSLSSQKRFIGNIAHELRNPLSIIKMNTELALLDPGVHPELRASLASNIEEMDRISEIINNLLSISILVQPERMKFNAVDISELIVRVVDKYANRAKQNQLQVSVRKDNDNVLVWGNATALEQIVGNVLKNAIHYTPAHGTVDIVLLSASNKHVEVIIRDSGIGISRKDIFHIFEPFYRAGSSHARDGSGLGLTMVSELVKMHSGKITVRSAPGRGTSVSVLLPKIENGKKTENGHDDSLNEVTINYLD
jgi:signal transduction histidine kinase